MKINRTVDEVAEVLFHALVCSCESCPVEKCTAIGCDTDDMCRNNLKGWLRNGSNNSDFDAHKTVVGMRLDAGLWD